MSVIGDPRIDHWPLTTGRSSSPTPNPHLPSPRAQRASDLEKQAAELLRDGRTVQLTFEKLQPVMQMQVGYNLRAADGTPVTGSVFHTIHTTGE